MAAQLDMVNKFLEGIEQGKIKLRDITVAPLALLNAIPASNMQGTVGGYRRSSPLCSRP